MISGQVFLIRNEIELGCKIFNNFIVEDLTLSIRLTRNPLSKNKSVYQTSVSKLVYFKNKVLTLKPIFEASLILQLNFKSNPF